MSKLKITLADAKAELRDAATGPDSLNWRYSPAVIALLNNHDELLAILGEATAALEEKGQRIAELERGQQKPAVPSHEEIFGIIRRYAPSTTHWDTGWIHVAANACLATMRPSDPKSD